MEGLPVITLGATIALLLLFCALHGEGESGGAHGDRRHSVRFDLHGALLPVGAPAVPSQSRVVASPQAPGARQSLPAQGEVRNGKDLSLPFVPLPKASPGAAVPGCQLAPCLTANPKAPRIWVRDRISGAGHKLEALFDGMAVASRNGLNFGGVIHAAVRTEHLLDYRLIVDEFFGVKGAFLQIFHRDDGREPKNFSANWKTVYELEEKKDQANLPPLSDIFLFATNRWPETRPAEEYYNRKLCNALRAPLLKHSLAFAPGRPTVALHVRRGDLRRDDPKAWGRTPDEYYYKAMQSVRAHLPNADIHVFSSTTDPRRHRVNYNSSDFDGYRERNATVHLDDADLIWVWAHMVRADVFIFGDSHFAWIPAVLNQGCTVKQGNAGHNLGDRQFRTWVEGKLSQENLTVQLGACLAKVGRVGQR